MQLTATTSGLLRSSSPDSIENSVVCLMAPTASGKTALAYELYDTGRYELISVDSALIYRDMNIGTAKPATEELRRYPHHLVNIIDPTQSYSVAEFVNQVKILIDHCHRNGKIPLLVGGTMMYYMALLEGLSPVPDSDETIRQQVEEWRQQAGIQALYEYLGQVDQITYKRLKPMDSQRITRAVEVYLQTNIPFSQWQDLPKQALANHPKQNWQVLSVMPDRLWLHERIAKRLDIMWEQGLVAEVLGLLARYPLTPNMPAMRCVGYRQVLEYLVHTDHPIFDQPHLDKEQFHSAFDTGALAYQSRKTNAKDDDFKAAAYQDMQDKTLYATRQLAKRQFTWLRKLSQLQTATVANSNTLTNSDRQAYLFDTIEQARDYLL